MGGNRRKGEMTSGAIDRGWPHQVALHESAVRGRNYVTVHYWIEAEGLSLCPRGHVFRRDHAYYNVFCFARQEDAQRFQRKFGGELMSPETRPRWRDKAGRRT
jgi:hypothetical protein